MEVSDFGSNVYRVCEIVLNNNEESTPLWDIKWDENTPNSILKKPSGRCYFIVVDGEIYKIGFSDCSGGVRKTIDTYRSQGNSGSPSDRTFAIHVYIAEELLQGKKVEVYFHHTEEIEVPFTLANGSVVNIKTSLSGKNIEVENLKIYKQNKGRLPLWNLQENNTKYPQYILDRRIKLIKEKNPIKLNEVVEILKNKNVIE